MKEVLVHDGPRTEMIVSEIPRPGDWQVVVKVEVADSNPKDWKTWWVSKPINQGNDMAGIVHHVGEGVSEFKVQHQNPFLPYPKRQSRVPLLSLLQLNNCVHKAERWLGKKGREILDAVQPFSLGARGCLGRKYAPPPIRSLKLYCPSDALVVLHGSNAWIDLTTMLTKLHFSYDLQLLSTELDSQRDSRMNTMWEKPELRVRFSRREAAAPVYSRNTK